MVMRYRFEPPDWRARVTLLGEGIDGGFWPEFLFGEASEPPLLRDKQHINTSTHHIHKLRKSGALEVSAMRCFAHMN